MENITIQNDLLKVEISPLGAELQSIVSKVHQTEYLWQGDATYWAGRAPVLFPIVGRLRNDTYTWQGREYSLPQHGFARKSTFETGEITPDSAVFRLADSAQTRKDYPFSFVLEVAYHLKGSTLEVVYSVTNRGEGVMPFSIGAHEAYNCPLSAGESFTDYRIVLGEKETIGRNTIADGLHMDETTPVLNGDNVIRLDYEAFTVDAYVFIGQRSQSAVLQSDGPRSVKVDFPGFGYLGIWTRPGAPFLCIEPWKGICDNVNADGELATKEGIILLRPGETSVCTHTITLS